MDTRKQVLIVTNAITEEELLQIKRFFSPENEHIYNIKIDIVHVIPRLPIGYFNIPSMNLLIQRYYEEAKQTLTHIGKHLDVSSKDQWLISGKVRTEVLRLATKLSSNFILASSQQIKELQRSLFFKTIQQYTVPKTVQHLK